MKKELIRIIYRGVRTAIAAGVTSALIIQPENGEYTKVLLAAFSSGFIVSLGMYLRDILDKHFDFDEKSLPNKLMPF